MTAASVTSRRRSRAGQGRSGLTWSAVTGETPPQSSMPASSRTAKSSREVGRGLEMDVGGQDQPGQGDGPQVGVVGRHGSCFHIAVPAFGRKFCTITSCT